MHDDNLHPPGYDHDTHPVGIGLERLLDRPDPAWGDVIGGIWDRLTDPLRVPGNETKPDGSA
jgi:hypothetical protein